MKIRIPSSGGAILTAVFLAFSVLTAGVASAQAQKAETLQGAIESLPTPGTSLEDALVIQEIALNELAKVDSQVAKLNAEKRSELMKKIGQLSYYASRSKGFVEAKMSIILFKYPDAFMWQNFLIFVRYAVVYPAMVSTGTSWLIPYVEPLPLELTMTMPYIWLRNLINRKIFQARVGVDPELLKTLLFQDLDIDLKTTNLHRLGRGLQGDTYWLLPIHSSKEELSWMSHQELEGMVSAKDPEFIRQLKLLNLETEDYENVLKLKIEEDEELYKALLEKAKKLAIDSAIPEEKRELMDFYLQTQELFNRIRLDSARSVPELALLNPMSYIPWFRGLMAKTWLAFKLNRFRSFQVNTLGRYYMARKSDPRAARAILDGALAEVATRRQELLSGVQNLKTRFASYLEPAHGAPIGLRCRALF